MTEVIKDSLSLELYYKPHCEDSFEAFGIPEEDPKLFIDRIGDTLRDVSQELDSVNTGDILFFCFRTGRLSMADLLVLDVIALNMIFSDDIEIRETKHSQRRPQ